MSDEAPGSSREQKPGTSAAEPEEGSRPQVGIANLRATMDSTLFKLCPVGSVSAGSHFERRWEAFCYQRLNSPCGARFNAIGNVFGENWLSSGQPGPTIIPVSGKMRIVLSSRPISSQGAYFIDRNGTHFDVILEYLRGGHLTLPFTEQERTALMCEAQFYQVGTFSDAEHEAKAG